MLQILEKAGDHVHAYTHKHAHMLVCRYVDTVLQMLEKAGDFVSEDIWHRVVQLITNNPSMQQYAARNTAEVLRRGATHEVRKHSRLRGWEVQAPLFVYPRPPAHTP